MIFRYIVSNDLSGASSICMTYAPFSLDVEGRLGKFGVQEFRIEAGLLWNREDTVRLCRNICIVCVRLYYYLGLTLSATTLRDTSFPSFVTDMS